MGRTFTEQDGEAGNEFAVVISDSFWRNHFGGEPAASVAAFASMAAPTPSWVSYREGSTQRTMTSSFGRRSSSRPGRGRTRRGIATPSDISRGSNRAPRSNRHRPRFDVLNATNLNRFPAFPELLINAGFRTVVNRLQDQLVKDVRATLYLMWGGAIFVLLIGCVNVANLALVRSRVRMKELATRLALGAGTWRVARQLTVEHLVLSCAAAVVGIAIGAVALESMGALSLQSFRVRGIFGWMRSWRCLRSRPLSRSVWCSDSSRLRQRCLPMCWEC